MCKHECEGMCAPGSHVSPHGLPSVHGGQCSLGSPPTRTLTLLGQGPMLMSSINFNHLPKGPSPNTDTVGNSIGILGDTVQSTEMVMEAEELGECGFPVPRWTGEQPAYKCSVGKPAEAPASRQPDRGQLKWLGPGDPPGSCVDRCVGRGWTPLGGWSHLQQLGLLPVSGRPLHPRQDCTPWRRGGWTRSRGLECVCRGWRLAHIGSEDGLTVLEGTRCLLPLLGQALGCVHPVCSQLFPHAASFGLPISEGLL